MERDWLHCIFWFLSTCCFACPAADKFYCLDAIEIREANHCDRCSVLAHDRRHCFGYETSLYGHIFSILHLVTASVSMEFTCAMVRATAQNASVGTNHYRFTSPSRQLRTTHRAAQKTPASQADQLVLKSAETRLPSGARCPPDPDARTRYRAIGRPCRRARDQ